MHLRHAYLTSIPSIIPKQIQRPTMVTLPSHLSSPRSSLQTTKTHHFEKWPAVLRLIIDWWQQPCALNNTSPDWGSVSQSPGSMWSRALACCTKSTSTWSCELVIPIPNLTWMHVHIPSLFNIPKISVVHGSLNFYRLKHLCSDSTMRLEVVSGSARSSARLCSIPQVQEHAQCIAQWSQVTCAQAVYDLVPKIFRAVNAYS